MSTTPTGTAIVNRGRSTGKLDVVMQSNPNTPSVTLPPVTVSLAEGPENLTSKELVSFRVLEKDSDQVAYQNITKLVKKNLDFLLDREHDIMTRLLYVWRFFSKYDKITYNPTLVINSGNAANLMFECTTTRYGGEKTEYIFGKCQLNDESDDMLVDNISGYILNTLVEWKSRNKYFMRYLDSCLMTLSLNTSQYIFNLAAMSPIVSNHDTLIQIISTNLKHSRPEWKPVKASFHEMIRGKGSLASCLKSQVITHEKLHDLLLPLFNSLKDLGQYGMCHNDAHLGNILVKESPFSTLKDPEVNLTLIDYGRMYFFGLNPKQKMLTDRIQFEKDKYGDDKYQNIVNYDDLLKMNNFDYSGIKSLSKTSQECVKFFAFKLYLFDVATITMNICVLLHQQGFLNQVIDPNILQMDASSLKITLLRPLSISKFYKSDASKQYSILYVGIWWFGLFLEALLRSALMFRTHGIPDTAAQQTRKACNRNQLIIDSIVKGQDPSHMVLDLSTLIDSQVMYYYFQLTDIPHPYWETMYHYMNNMRANFSQEFDHMTQDLKLSQKRPSRAQTGSAKRPKTLVKHQTEVQHVNKSYFEQKKYMYPAQRGSGSGPEKITSFRDYYNSQVPLTPSADAACQYNKVCEKCSEDTMDLMYIMVKNLLERQQPTTGGAAPNPNFFVDDIDLWLSSRSSAKQWSKSKKNT